MLVHRVAEYYKLYHHVDQSGKCVVVSKQIASTHPRLSAPHSPNYSATSSLPPSQISTQHSLDASSEAPL